MRRIDRLVKNSGSPFPDDFWEQCDAHDKLVDERIRKDKEAEDNKNRSFRSRCETVNDREGLRFNVPKTNSHRAGNVETVKVTRFSIPECQTEKSKLIGDTIHESVRFKS